MSTFRLTPLANLVAPSTFIDAQHPTTVLPPAYPGSPFTIPESWYHAVLHPSVPLTIAAVYAASVHLANHFANGKPYAIAKTKAFKAFVVAHNVFLAVYSAWTFFGMVGAVSRSTQFGKNGFSGGVAELCRIDKEGGLWEQGLAFYGWWFYLSKFYEVVDTMVILAKGKKSSTLQTYHHAGAMLCMWAGVRFMASPIWIFCVFNSLIHTLMYTYYAISALRLPFPMFLKRSLTSLQITQFLVGGSLAASYLFIEMKEAASPTWSACMRTPGEIFAVVLNCVYLTPLTYLFVRFFIESYTKRGKKAASTASNGIKSAVANGNNYVKRAEFTSE